MFNQLIESGSHRKDMARKGRFFLGALGFYMLLLAVAGVASVYAYDSHLSTQNLELYTLVALPPATVQEQERPDEPRRPAAGTRSNEIAQRTDAIERLLDSTRPPDTISTERNRVAEIPKNRSFVISDRNTDPADNGGALNNLPGGVHVPNNNRNAVVVPVTRDDPEPPRATPSPAPVKPPERIRVASSVISSKIITKPAPAYPVIAKQVRAQGTVTVEILIDEQGRVVSAHATSGHSLLRAAAQQSAYQARFSPTSISGQPVKVSGVITYNFILQ